MPLFEVCVGTEHLPLVYGEEVVSGLDDTICQPPTPSHK